jgi:hypothetical protein
MILSNFRGFKASERAQAIAWFVLHSFSPLVPHPFVQPRVGAFRTAQIHPRRYRLERQRRLADNRSPMASFPGSLLLWSDSFAQIYPSWGYMVRQGATTIWELWNGDTANPAMNSGNRKKNSKGFHWKITVPANTTATLYVPAESVDAVKEGGRPAAMARKVKFARMEPGRAVFEISSGNYNFETKPAEFTATDSSGRYDRTDRARKPAP